MKGKLIIIESGTDGSGKATQAELLYEKIIATNENVKKITFPNYESDSSALVKMYLNGHFGNNPTDVNPYVASSFYSVDRFASYKTEWEDFINNGGIIISDRYTTSNMVHQASKITNKVDKDKYLDWLWDFEFNKFNLPIPTCVVFLNMPPEHTQTLMENRVNKITGEVEKDIHEKDERYLINSYNNALYIAEKYSWIMVNCIENGQIRTVESINAEIVEIVMKFL
ncbi:MAG: thymidylate kinase [Firmicutes bacterium HGW-Firmicutes-7]|nr:MAG: thymidylate kinase [Firmicutes bacterium HGW-Firmicutes-7]